MLSSLQVVSMFPGSQYTVVLLQAQVKQSLSMNCDIINPLAPNIVWTLQHAL